MTPRPGEENDGGVEDIELEMTPHETTSHKPEGTRELAIGSHTVSIDQAMMPYLGQIVAGIILFIAILTPPGSVKNEGFGIAGAAIAIVLACFGCFLMANEAMREKALGDVPFLGPLTIGSATAKFIYVCWFITAGILTFSGPFEVTSNGYFACWGGVLLAAMGLGSTPESMKATVEALGYYNFMVVASVVQICATPEFISGSNGGEALYALIVAVLTLIGILAFQAYEKLTPMQFPFFAIFAILWLVSAGLTTFRGPFTVTGNGYFSAWLGAIVCSMLAAISRATTSSSESS